MLILRACGIAGEDKECVSIKTQAEMYGLEVSDNCPRNNEEVASILQNGDKFDYIYLSSHGNEIGFASEDGVVDYSWEEFGRLLCETGCMNDDCVILLSCCRGGLNQVAYTLFMCCDHISYVIGPRQSLYPSEMLIGYNILLFNMEKRRMDAVVACDKIQSATDLRFVCFDRLETEIEPSYLTHKEEYNIRRMEEIQAMFNQDTNVGQN